MRIALAIITLLIFPSVSSAQSPESNVELAARIQRIENNLQPKFQITGKPLKTYNISERLKELGIPGLSLAVVKNGKIEIAKGYGSADVSEGRAVDAKTLFLAGSISKPVAALRIHQLAEKGTVDLDVDVNQYLASWKVPENEFTAKEKVTLRRILNHTAGLTVWGFPGYVKGDEIPSVAGVLDGKGNTDPVRVFREPGQAWLYSGGGYTVMQLLIADIEKTDFPDLMQKNVLEPLGMTESTFENPLPKKYHAIAATGYRSNGTEVEGKWPIYPEMAAAGLWTTPSQLIKYAIEIQRIGQTKTDGILKTKTIEEMLTPGLNGHGLGPTTTEHTFGHGGSDQGFQAKLVAWNDSANAVVVMVNSDNGQIMEELLRSIADEYDLPGFEVDKKTTIALSQASLSKFTGTYHLPGLGNATISVKDDGLQLKPEPKDAQPVFLLPESDNVFFDESSGRTIRFQLEGGTVKGFALDGSKMKAQKLDNSK